MVAYLLTGIRVGVEQPVYNVAINNGFRDYLGNVFHARLPVENIVWFDNYQRALFTETVAAGSPDIHPASQLLPLNLLFEGGNQFLTAAGMAPAAVAYSDTGFGFVPFGYYRFSQCF